MIYSIIFVQSEPKLQVIKLADESLEAFISIVWIVKLNLYPSHSSDPEFQWNKNLSVNLIVYMCHDLFLNQLPIAILTLDFRVFYEIMLHRVASSIQDHIYIQASASFQ